MTHRALYVKKAIHLSFNFALAKYLPEVNDHHLSMSVFIYIFYASGAAKG